VIDCVDAVHPVRQGDDYAVQSDSLDKLLWKVEKHISDRAVGQHTSFK